MITRRNFLTGLVASPVVIRTPGLLMPVKSVIEPPAFLTSTDLEMMMNEFNSDIVRAFLQPNPFLNEMTFYQDRTAWEQDNHTNDHT